MSVLVAISFNVTTQARNVDLFSKNCPCFVKELMERQNKIPTLSNICVNYILAAKISLNDINQLRIPVNINKKLKISLENNQYKSIDQNFIKNAECVMQNIRASVEQEVLSQDPYGAIFSHDIFYQELIHQFTNLSKKLVKKWRTWKF